MFFEAIFQPWYKLMTKLLGKCISVLIKTKK